jgi:hypothetical protein
MREENTYCVRVRKPEGKRPLGRPSLGWIILKLTFMKLGGMAWSGILYFRAGASGGLL